MVGGDPVTSPVAARSTHGDEVEVDVPDPAEAAAVLRARQRRSTVPVVHEDDDLLVIDKPAGLVVHPGARDSAPGTLVHGLLARYPELVGVGGDPERPGIVHRLDKGTSGLLLVARTPEAYEALVGALSARAVHRRYRALVWGTVEAAHRRDRRADRTVGPRAHPDGGR